MYQRDVTTGKTSTGTVPRIAMLSHDSVCAGCCCGGTHHRDQFTGTAERGVHRSVGNSCLLAPNHDRPWAVRRARLARFCASRTAAGSHPNTALMGEIAVWRAANGIKPQDPRPTAGTQLETLPALWKQRLDRHIAHSADLSDNARADERQRAHTHIDAGATTGKAHTKQLVNVRTGQSRPADSTAQWFGSRRSEHEVALHAAMAGQDGRAAHCRIWLSQIKGQASPAKRRVSSLRCVPRHDLSASVVHFYVNGPHRISPC
jgi:hypothetical protein